MLCKNSAANDALIAKCASLTQYRPTPFYLLDYYGHVHTIAFSMIRQLFNRRLLVDRELFKLSDGGTVGLDWVINPHEQEADAIRPLAVLVHPFCTMQH